MTASERARPALLAPPGPASLASPVPPVPPVPPVQPASPASPAPPAPLASLAQPAPRDLRDLRVGRDLRVLFRADASHALGFGHVARIAALIEECAPLGIEPLAVLGGDAAAIRAWAGIGAVTSAIDAGEALVGGARSAEAVAAAAAGAGVAAVVVDGPALAPALIAALPAGVRAILVDDAGGRAPPVAAVVNHNFHAPALAPAYAGAARRLLGRRYLMLRRSIRARGRGACPIAPAAGARLRVAVTFGGSDPVGATARVLALVPAARPLDLAVLAGPGFRDEAGLRAAVAAARAAGHAVEVHRAPPDPGAVLASCHAAICAAGGTLGELAYLGCPALAYALVPDQLAPAAHQRATGLIAGGGPLAAASDAALRADLRAFLEGDAARLARRQRALATADGAGPRRVLAAALAP